MKHLAALLIVLVSACSGGGADKPTGPAAVASVSLSASATTVSVGGTVTLTVSPKDASGNALTGRAVTWTTASPAVATVSTAGVVTGVAPGSAVITATIDTKSANTSIIVSQSGPNCTGVTPISLTVGQVRVLSGTERATLCLSGGAAATEYALIPANLAVPTGTAALSFVSTNTQAAVGAPLSASSSASRLQSTSASAISSLAAVTGHAPRNRAFERSLRAREGALQRSIRAARSNPGAALLRRQAMGAGAVAIKDLPSSPAIGTLVSLNAEAFSACSSPKPRTARVVAVSNAAIVVADTAAPAGGFSSAEYLSIATTFDTLVFALDTTAFGAPFDMDNNGRVLMFFTHAVNQLTSASGSGGVIGGFFFERDLIPRVANAIVPFACATSNEGEMFYLPVVDANSAYNPFFKDKAALLSEINATTVHEFQHLINASRRIYITPEIVDSEEQWLNEGMSHLAEELLYYKVTGLSPKTDLTFAASTGTSGTSLYANMVAYQVDNMDRYDSYLSAPEANSPYATVITDANDLSTRGATWGLLRYALDQSPGTNASYLRALVNAPTQGVPNFNTVFASAGGLSGATRNYIVADFTDNAGFAVPAQYTHLSWNFRDWLPHFVFNQSKYPLFTRSLVTGAAVQVSLAAGGSSYLRFRVPGGATAGIAATITAATPTAVDLILVRTQ